MSWFRKLLGQEPRLAREDYGPGSDYWFTQIGPRSSAGVTVTHANALAVSALFACVRILSESVAQLPLPLFQRERNGDKTLLYGHPLYALLHDQPNSEHTACEFREKMQASLSMRGTAIAEIIPGASYPIGELIPLHPDHIRIIKPSDGVPRFEIHEPNTAPRVLLRDEVFIVRALQLHSNGLTGIDPIMAQAQSVGNALAATDYAGRFFANDARPAGIIKHPGHFKDKEARRNFLSAWREALTGSNRHSLQVLEYGLEYQDIGITNEQAQLLETRRYNDIDISRIFRVPPYKIGILEQAIRANIEQQAIEFVTDTLTPWLVRWEQAIKRDLIINQPQLYAEFNTAALLRGDLKSRYQAYAIGRNWGWLSVNEIRRRENLNSIGEAGDQYLQPLNMVPAGAEYPPDDNRADDRAGPTAEQWAADMVRAGRMAGPYDARNAKPGHNSRNGKTNGGGRPLILRPGSD